MIQLIIIIIVIISLFKPDILLSKKMKEQASNEQKKIYTNNLRIILIFPMLLSVFSILYGYRSTETIGMVLMIISIVLFFIAGLPKAKECLKIKNELK